MRHFGIMDKTEQNIMDTLRYGSWEGWYTWGGQNEEQSQHIILSDIK